MINSKTTNKEEYNQIPLHYCEHCLSIKVLTFDDKSFCDDCGSMDIVATQVEEWEEMYKEKYGEKYLNK